MIPYVRDISFDYGAADQVSPLIRRVIANNAGPFTFTGTGTYIVGSREVAVIDPGPELALHPLESPRESRSWSPTSLFSYQSGSSAPARRCFVSSRYKVW